MFTLRNRQRVKSVVVRCGSRAFSEHPGPDQGLAGGLVRDVAAHRDLYTLVLRRHLVSENGRQHQCRQNDGCKRPVIRFHIQNSLVQICIFLKI